MNAEVKELWIQRLKQLESEGRITPWKLKSGESYSYGRALCDVYHSEHQVAWGDAGDKYTKAHKGECCEGASHGIPHKVLKWAEMTPEECFDLFFKVGAICTRPDQVAGGFHKGIIKGVENYFSQCSK